MHWRDPEHGTAKNTKSATPEYSFGAEGKTWLHVAAHLGLGTTVGPLVGWLVGCLIMSAAKKLASKERDENATAGA